MATLQEEISRRRTFAIISHPDAGKTTLTEKFLLYGGAIAQAGEVKGKRERAAKSDWMEIEMLGRSEFALRQGFAAQNACTAQKRCFLLR